MKLYSKKRLVSIFIAFLGFLISPGFCAIVSLPNISGNQGSSVDIPIMVDDPVGIAGFQFTVIFNDSILSLQSPPATVGSLTSGWMSTYNSNIPGQITIAGVNPSLQGLPPGQGGSLVILKFNVIGTPQSNTPLTFTECKLRDNQSQSIQSTPVNGNFTVNPSASQPVLVVSPEILDFGTTYIVRSLIIQNAGTGILNWTIGNPAYNEGTNWITSINPTSGSTTSETDIVNITIDRNGLDAGIYTATLPLNSNEGKHEIFINMEVVAEGPTEKTISIPQSSGQQETQIEIPININNASDIAGFQFTVTFDNSVLNATGAVAGSLTNGWLLQVNPQAGQISVIGASATALGSVSGSLCILQFNVVGNPGNSTNLSFTVHKLSDANAQQITHNVVNGNFAVSGYRISGYVSLTGGTSSVSAVSLNLTGTVNKTTNPDSNGYYEFTDLMPDNYTITPVLNRYTFSPVNKTYTPLNSSQTNQNFTGTFQAQLDISSLYGIPNPSTGTHIYASGTLISASVNSPVSGPSGTRYVCSGWTGTGSVPATGTSNSLSFTINQDSTLTWNWKTQYLLTYSAEPATGGIITLTPTAQGNWYDTGQIITCTYVQTPGYIFEKWLINGAEAGSNPILDVTMNTPKQITAVFKQIGFILELDRNIVDVVLDADTFVETQVLISVNPVGQYSKIVNLSAETIPETGIALSFHPGNGVVPFDSILNIHLSESIKPDTYLLEITGASEDEKNTYDIAVIAKTKVYIPDTYCANIKGETCLVPINISTAKGLTAFQMKIIYDKNVLNAINVKQGELTTNWNIIDSMNQGEIQIGGVNTALHGLEDGKGSICTVTFSVVGNIPEVGVPIIFESVKIADKEARSMPYVSENGIVLPGIKGDFNHDSVVDIFDVILCLRQALEIDPSVDNADMNKDGVVDIFDVILVLRKALGID